MKAELKRAADLVAFQRREALARKRLSARECARQVIPTLDAILDFVIGFGLLALAMLGVAAACVAAGAPDSITRTAALLGVGFITALSLHRLGRK